MQARFTLKTNDDIGLYYSTVCDLQLTPRNAQIVFKETINKDKFLTQLGITASKILIYRTKLDAKENIDRAEDPQLYVLSEETFGATRAIIELNDADLYLMADDMKIKIAKNKVSATAKCFLGIEDKKSEESILHLTCLPIENFE